MLAPAKPLVLLLVAAYAYGAPACDGARPALLDAPLHGFHQDVTLLVVENCASVWGTSRGTSQIARALREPPVVQARLLQVAARGLAGINGPGRP